MIREFKFVQKADEVKHDYPTTTIKKPFCEDALIYILDMPSNSISVQLILMLHMTDKFEQGKEIDVIQYATINTPLIPLRQMTDNELMHLLTDATKLCVKKCNEILKGKYPKAKPLTDYSQSTIRKTWDVTVQRTKKDNPNFLEGTQWGIS